MSTKSQLQSGRRYGIRTWGFGGGGTWGTSLDEVLPEAPGELPANFLNAVSMNYITLMTIFLSASFLIFSPPLVMEVPPQYSGFCWRGVGFSSCIQEGVGTHTPLSWWAIQGEGWCWKSSFYPLHHIIFILFYFFTFSPTACWNLSSGKLYFYKYSLVHIYLPKSASPGFP